MNAIAVAIFMAALLVADVMMVVKYGQEHPNATFYGVLFLISGVVFIASLLFNVIGGK